MEEKSLKNRLAAQSVTILVTIALTIAVLIALGFFKPKYVVLPESADSNYYKPQYAIQFDSKGVNYENIKKYNEVKELIKKEYYKTVDDNTLIEGSIAGLADSLKDPYTVYYDKEQMKKFSEKTEGSYVGIGVSITLDENGLLNIVETFDASPAKTVGILKGDKITKVDDKDVTAIRDENLVIKMIKGPENTKVKITVYRPATGKFIDFNIERKKIKISNINSEMLNNNIGYIRIVSFDQEIGIYFEEHLKKLIDKGLTGLVIDLRDNPGGDYNQVVAIADRLLPKGLIVYTEDKDGKKDIQNSDEKDLKLPIAVLVNGNSASASEVLSGALKDHKKGFLVGTKTFGKGLVQSVIGLKDGSGIKITIARYFTPSGVCIQGKGIEPDYLVEQSSEFKDMSVSDIPKDKDTQLMKAIEVIKN